MKKISREAWLIGYADEYRHWCEIRDELVEKASARMHDRSVSAWDVTVEQRKRRHASGQPFYVVDDHEFFEITATEAGARWKLACDESQPRT